MVSVSFKFLVILLLFPLIASAKIFEGNNACLSVSSENSAVSSYLVTYKNGKPENCYFQISNVSSSSYFISPENFVISHSKDAYPLVNFALPFFDMKDCAMPYIHPEFLVKFIHILAQINFNPRISDALRTSENQLRYKRRGWTNTENSPHMVGLAADLVYYSASERDLIRSLCEELNLRFLEHGRGANRHIHIQDNSVWNTLDTSVVKSISDVFNYDADKDKFCRAAAFSELTGKSFDRGQTFQIEGEGKKLLRVEFEDALGIKSGTFVAGVFNSESTDVTLNINFLPPGIFKMNVFVNDELKESKIIAVN